MPNVAAYWFKPPVTTSTTAGMHRLVWDMRYPTPPSLDFNADGIEADTVSFGIIAGAVIGESPKQQPVGSLVLPGTYQVRLTLADLNDVRFENQGQKATRTRQLTITNDPRSEATAADLALQMKYERALATGLDTSRKAIDAIRALQQSARQSVAGRAALDAALAAFNRAAGTAITALAGNRSLAGQLADLEYADMKPTETTIAAVMAQCARADTALDRYREFIAKDLAALNSALTTAGGAVIPAPAAMPARACGG
jgi:hypothetical protein